jgi:hypothetical protein
MQNTNISSQPIYRNNSNTQHDTVHSTRFDICINLPENSNISQHQKLRIEIESLLDEMQRTDLAII